MTLTAASRRACGTRAKYVLDKCRCDACRVAAVDYERERRNRHAPAYVGADRARQHVRWLSEQGIGWKRVAALAGVSNGSVGRLLYGRDGRSPSKRIRPELEAKILGVLPDRVADGAYIDGARTHDNIGVLVERGWSKAAIGRHVHGPQAKSLQVGTLVTARTARIVEGLLALPVEGKQSRYDDPRVAGPTVEELHDTALRDEARREEARIRRAKYRADDDLDDVVEDRDAEAVGIDLAPLPEGIDLAWKAMAACRRPEFPNWLFFPGRGDARTVAAARAACARCPVHVECLDFALVTKAEGIWAGTTEKQRRRLRREQAVA